MTKDIKFYRIKNKVTNLYSLGSRYNFMNTGSPGRIWRRKKDAEKFIEYIKDRRKEFSIIEQMRINNLLVSWEIVEYKLEEVPVV